eukprot:TRINITY_DN24413_c0_g1_i4.p1 TRINITY_DN24413_c0_g1~~TRINITY_DN24413_c0_g1_i4.p1  ORF type:complete len:107 (-),score=9.92 TRINITY_DN24413_c0_g1_i4:1121-1441(-)
MSSVRANKCSPAATKAISSCTIPSHFANKPEGNVSRYSKSHCERLAAANMNKHAAEEKTMDSHSTHHAASPSRQQCVTPPSLALATLFTEQTATSCVLFTEPRQFG